jgi:hypothetical protein
MVLVVVMVFVKFALAVLIVSLTVAVCALSAHASGSEVVSLSIDVGENMDDIDDVVDKNISSMSISADEAYELTVPANISFSIEAYRGATLKRTVYVSIQDSEGNKISSTAKFSLPTRFQGYNLSGEVKIAKSYEDGTYFVVAEGIDADASDGIQLFFEAADSLLTEADSGSVSFDIVSSPASVSPGQSLSVRVAAHNPTGTDLEFDAWSYVYLGSKCVSDSGAREYNRKTINFPEHSNITFDLENIIGPGTEPGDYTLKISILRSDRKTPVELKRTITVTANDTVNRTATGRDDASTDIKASSPSSASPDYTPSKKNITLTPLTVTGAAGFDPLNETNNSGTTYLSSSAKAKNLVVFIMMIVIAGIAIAVVLKKL